MLNDLIKFIEWTAVKSILHTSHRIQHPKKKEIWFVALGYNIGVEMNGKNSSFERPVLILREFSSESMLVAPLTSKVGTHKYCVEFTDSIGQTSAANLYQLRTLSTKRFLRKISFVDDAAFNIILESIIEHILIKAEPPE